MFENHRVLTVGRFGTKVVERAGTSGAFAGRRRRNGGVSASADADAAAASAAADVVPAVITGLRVEEAEKGVFYESDGATLIMSGIYVSPLSIRRFISQKKNVHRCGRFQRLPRLHLMLLVVSISQLVIETPGSAFIDRSIIDEAISTNRGAFKFF